MMRRLPIGAEPMPDGLVHLRVWAPAVSVVEAVLNDGATSIALAREPDGYFSGVVEGAAGLRYGYRLDGSDKVYPDPASRFQPEGPHRLSEVVDPLGFAWSDRQWPGVSIEGQVIYELHVGTFTKEGTWDAAARELDALARLGITVIELMPIADFDGRFGWGYDGVNLYAPSRLYGRPDDLRRFVDTAHGLGLGVILDVVYNHLGPSGNYLRSYSPQYFTDRYENEWGDAIDFDGPHSAPVREFFIENAGYWIDEFHFDGLRLDATQQIFDRSDTPVLAAIARRVRERARGRSTIVVAENERQESRLARPVEQGGYGLDALWNDDFHHSATVALTGRAEAYYSDTRGTPQELISAMKYGYLFQGQYYQWQQQRRGSPSLDLDPSQFVVYLQNHDQVANSARGYRGHQLSSPGRWRAMTALLLLGPATPMLFQGQEFSASSPFLYFADFEPDLAAAVRKGRGEFLAQFPSIAAYLTGAPLDDPGDIHTFERCKLDFAERVAHAEVYALHEDLLRIRRETPALRVQRRQRIDGAVLGSHAFGLRFFGDAPADDRLLIVNLGADLDARSFAEPLVAPPDACDWTVRWSSEQPRYGGGGAVDLWRDGTWSIPGDSAALLEPGPMTTPSERRIRRRTA